LKEEEKLEIAKFRFGVISDFVTGVRFGHGEREKLLRDKCARKYTIPFSSRTNVSRGSIALWIAKYRAAGNQLSGLMPLIRADAGTYKKLDLSVRMAIADLKKDHPKWTLKTIVAKLREKYVLKPDEQINTATCYRFLQTLDLSATSGVNADRRSFEAAYPNAIWQCDVLHGPQVITDSGALRKSYLIAILDDHSRLITHAQFCLNETAEMLKKCLLQAIQKRGIPQKFYVDNGACYRAEALSTTCAWLGVALIHSRPYIPQGRGKIERFFRNVRDSFLQRLSTAPQTLENLNEQFSSWLDLYHNREHGTTGQTPLQKYTADMASVRPAPANIESFFREKEDRVVRRDRTVQLGGKFYEVPQGLIGKKVELRFFADDPEKIEVFLLQHSHGFARLMDAQMNASLGRDLASSGGPVGEKKGNATAVVPARERGGGVLFGSSHVQEEQQ
jgi:putative transposase